MGYTVPADAPHLLRMHALCLQPAVFLPHSAIRSVELMRAGGASSTFDVVLHLKK